MAVIVVTDGKSYGLRDGVGVSFYSPDGSYAATGLDVRNSNWRVIRRFPEWGSYMVLNPSKTHRLDTFGGVIWE